MLVTFFCTMSVSIISKILCGWPMINLQNSKICIREWTCISIYQKKSRKQQVSFFHISIILAILSYCKGQLISKANCQAVNSSKIRTNEFVFTTMRRVFVRFLREFSARKKKRFEIFWPLACKILLFGKIGPIFVSSLLLGSLGFGTLRLFGYAMN